MTLLEHVFTAGFPLGAPSVIEVFADGSQLHRTTVEGYDDLDVYGCYIKPTEHILGLDPLEHLSGRAGLACERTPRTTRSNYGFTPSLGRAHVNGKIALSQNV